MRHFKAAKSVITGCAFALAASSAWADGVLHFGQTATLPNLNPYILAPAYDPMVANVFDTLTRYDENLVPQPRLAESWSVFEDELTLTMTLRADVTFHDGTPFTSEAVKNSFDFVMNPDNGALIRGLAGRITSVETPDDRTVVINLSQPFPGIFDFLELFYIVDGETAEDFSSTANGTGRLSWRAMIPER